ncbi:MAG: peptidoglycan DD-metalloendopeptidase family protein [Mangrovibacterium sp.]
MNEKTTKITIASLLVVLVLGAFIYLYSNHQKQDKVEEATEQLSVEELHTEPPMIFGLPADSFLVEQYEVKRNQNLSDILGAEGVSYPTMLQLVSKSKDIFDVRRIKVGNNYYFLRAQNDSTAQARYFVYEQDAINYVVFQLSDSLITYQGAKEVHTVLKSTSGVITSSLWNSLIGNGASPALAVELADVYAWTIDFFGIQRGDSYKVVYEENYVDSISVGIQSVQACLFDHMGSKYYGFPFEQDSVRSFYNEKGESLRKAFLKAPLNYKRVSSGFSNARKHPVLKIVRPHHGVDYAAATGTPVMTIGDGTVVKKSYQKRGAGYYLKIKHNSVYTTTYMHLSKYAKGISVGKRVKQGEVIGYVGATGIATGPHLDFRVQKNGTYINPLKMESPPVEPVSEANMPAYELLRDSLMQELNAVKLPTGSTQTLEEVRAL